MSLLSAHLEQIAYSCEGIDSLPFPPPKIFTNALLSNHDITTLLRDTEPHERALFSVPPPASTAGATEDPPRASTSASGSAAAAAATGASTSSSSRRQTVFNVSSGEVTTGGPPTRASARRNTAVAAVLGGAMHERLRRSELSSKDDVDVEVLLRGAEKLCGVYALPGASRTIAELRGREADLARTTAYYEAKVAEQAEALAAMSKDWRGDGGYGDEEEEEEEEEADAAGVSGQILTDAELKAEEEEVRELERKKRDLQERLKRMDRDIGGLLHM